MPTTVSQSLTWSKLLNHRLSILGQIQQLPQYFSSILTLLCRSRRSTKWFQLWRSGLDNAQYYYSETVGGRSVRGRSNIPLLLYVKNSGGLASRSLLNCTIFFQSLHSKCDLFVAVWREIWTHNSRIWEIKKMREWSFWNAGWGHWDWLLTFSKIPAVL